MEFFDHHPVVLQGPPSRNLDVLMMWLDGDRRCRVCGKQFLPCTSWKQRFDRHLNTHSGARPFACPYCSHQCSRKDALKLHMQRRHGNTISQASSSVHLSDAFGETAISNSDYSGSIIPSSERLRREFTCSSDNTNTVEISQSPVNS